MALSYDGPVQAPRGTQRPAPRKAGSPRDCAHVSCPWKQSYWKGVWACTIDGGDRGQVFEYLQLEELQRWEGNQLLHTERLTLYQVHLETNETLIIAPTTSTASKGCVSAAPHPVGGPGRALCWPRKQQHAPTSLGTESASRGAWGTETELHILAAHGTRWFWAPRRVSYQRRQPWSGPARAGCHRRAGQGACNHDSCHCCI